MPNPKVRKRLNKLAVGLAAHCDPPKVEEKLLHDFTKRFHPAPSLPFVAFVTHDYKWVHGFHGGRSVKQFLADLDIVEASALLPADEKIEKQLAALAEKATAAADEEDWAGVVKLSRQAGKTKGNCEGRDAIAELRAQAADSVELTFDEVMGALLESDDSDLAPLKATLAGVATTFKGEPEAQHAVIGQKAIERYRALTKLEGAAHDTALARGAKDFADTPWAILFEAE